MNVDDLLNGRTGIAAAALLAAVGFGFTSVQTPTMAAPSGMSELAKLAAAGGVDALQQMLDARSPGLRAPGALTQTKGRPIASLKDGFGPKERVLSNGRTRPVAPGTAKPAITYETGSFNGPDLFAPGAPILPTADASIGDLSELPPTSGSFPTAGGGTPPIIIGGGGGGGSGGGGGGGGSIGGGSGGGDTPGVGSAVPEPATWLSLLIGFFAIGFSLRSTATRRPSLNVRALR